MNTETTIKTIMEKFGDDTRYDVVDGDLFITNSKMLFRLKKTELTEELKRYPTIGEKCTRRIWSNVLSALTATSIDLAAAIADSPVEMEKCKTCKGVGVLYICRDCNGDGEKTCPHCDSEYDCKTCKGTGYVEKSNILETCHCGGSGFKLTEFKIAFGAIQGNFDLRLLHLINSVCKVRLHAPEINKDKDHISPAYFREEEDQNGIDGIVMQLCLDGSDE